MYSVIPLVFLSLFEYYAVPMSVMIKNHVHAVSWCGIVILCVAIFFQLLGAPGTLFDVADSEDDFQASVMFGYTITSNTPVFLPWATSFFGFTEIASVSLFLRLYKFFHPPLFA